MEIQQLYNMALNMIANIKSTSGNMPSYDNMAMCLILTGKGQIFTGINGTRIDSGILKNTCAAHSAIMSMMMTQETSAAKVIKVMFRDGSVAVPCDDCLRLVYGINDNNKFTEIAVSDTETVMLENLIHKNEAAESENTVKEADEAPSAGGIMSPEDFVQSGMGFDELSDEAAEYVDKVELDKSNPFYDAPQANNVQNPSETLTGPMQYASIPGVYSQPKSLYQTPQTAGVYAPQQNPMQSQMNPMGYNNTNTYAQQPVMQPQGNVYTPYTPQQGGYYNPYQQAMPNAPQAVPVTPQQMNNVPQGMPVSPQMNEMQMNTSYQQVSPNTPYYSPMQNDAQVSQQNPYYQAPYQQQSVNGMYSGQVQPVSAQQPVQQSVYSNELPQSNSVPVNESMDAESIYKKRLSSLLGNGSSDSQPFASGGAENSALMDELKKSAKEKKKNAKIDAKFAKKIKRQGY